MNSVKTIILFLLFCPTWIFGQFSDGIGVNECNICNPRINKRDVDNDGYLDIIVSSFNGSSKLVWYRNLGNGEFSELKVMSNQTNSFIEEIELIETLRTIEGLESFDFSDIDGDNEKDLVYSLIFTANRRTENRLAWRKNSGDFNFLEEQIISFNCGISDVVTADLNGDNHLDIVTIQRLGICDGKIMWFENDGHGNFAEVRIISDLGDGFRALNIKDVDGDGSLDVAVIKGGGFPSLAQLVWYENDGLGNFGNQQIINRITNAQVFKSADIDGDGDIDFVSHSKQEERIAWYENKDNGANFIEHVLNPHSVGFYDFEIADFTNDNQLDLLVSSWSNDRLMLFENDNQNFLLHVIEEGIPAEGTAILAIDMDKDADLDIVSASAKDGRITWDENDGLGNFNTHHQITTSAKGAFSIRSADLDNNGDNDIVAALLHENKIVWYPNDNGNFSDGIIISTDVQCPWDVYTADLDGDRDIDVLSASNCDDKIAWYENNGQGKFSEQKIISLDENAPNQVNAVDLDGDGDLDILSGGFVGDVLSWHENYGTGNFSSINVISSKNDTRVESIFSADMDGDGDMDVLSIHPFRDKVAWYKNDGSGNFSEQLVISTKGNFSSDIFAVDLDCDGDMDVVSTVYRGSEFGEGLVWYRNEGLENFSDQLIISTDLDFVEAIYAADLDGDNDLDLMSAARGGIKVAWHKNLMDPSQCKTNVFQNATNLLAFPNPSHNFLNLELTAINPTSPPILSLFDNTGIEVESYKITNRFIRLPISHLNNGLYFYSISDKDGRVIANSKVVKF